MKEISELVLTLLEFILLGGLTAFVLLYAFIWIHPVKKWLSDYYEDAKAFLLGEGPSTAPARTWVGGAVLLGCLYAAGSLTNAVGYWLLEPVHNADLAPFYWSLRTEGVVPSCASAAKAQAASLPLKEWMLLNRILWTRQGTDCERLTYASFLNDEAFWRTASPEAAADGLDGLIKHIRIARGVALCAFGIAFLAVFKIAGAIIVLFATLLPRGKGSGRLYKSLINATAAETVTVSEIRKRTRERAAVYLLTLALGAGLYVVAAKGWMSAEREFHGLAYFGATAAKEKVRAESVTSTRPESAERVSRW